MPEPRIISKGWRWAAIWPAVVMVLLVILGTQTVSAESQDPEAEGPTLCLGCHPAKMEAWGMSRHARLEEGATCESCHGSYVEGHPVNGHMLLDSDSCVCQTCHTDTHGQWQSSAHAESGVQCIGCHQVHSQQLRLNEETLCISCHADERNSTLHVSHLSEEVSCTECHFATGKDAVQLAGNREVPNHTAVASTAGACIDCHLQRPGHLLGAVDVRVALEAAESAQLADELTAAHDSIRSLQTLSLVTLGAGMGGGAILGAILVLAIGVVCSRGQRDE